MKNNQAPQPVPPTPEQVRNAFRISLGAACAMGLILISYVVFPPTYSYANETTILTILVGLAGLLSTWLSRRQRSNLGVIILVIVLQFAVLMTSLRTSGMGIDLALITLVITFGIATSSLPSRLSNLTIALAIIIGVAAILLDLTEPWQREPVENPIMMWGTGGGLTLLFLYVIARQFHTYRLRTKITIVVLGVSLITAGVLLGISQNTFSRYTQNYVEQSLESRAWTYATAIGDFLLRQSDTLTALAINDAIQTNLRESNAAYAEAFASRTEVVIPAEIASINQYWQTAASAQNDTDPFVQSRLNNPAAESLRDFLSYFPTQADVLLTNQYGALIAASSLTPDFYLAEMDWWQESYDTGKVAIAISQNETTDTKNVYIAVPVRDTVTGEIIGILRSTILANNIVAVLAYTPESARYIDIIVDGMIWANSTGQEGTMQIPQGLWEQIRNAADAGNLEANYREELCLLGYAPIRSSTQNQSIQELGWVVVISEAKSSALVIAQTQSRQNLLLALGVIAFAAVASTALAKLLTAPIVRLTRVAQEIAAGDTRAQAVVETGDEVGLLATSFNDMTSELRQSIESLEQRIAERTKALEATIDVSQRISTILDPNQLTREIANDLQSVFNYYHVHVYLLDDTKEYLVMVGGSGEAGRVMLARGHQISSRAGLVGHTASNNQPTIVPDVSQDPNWLPNPLLPDTKSEVAVPISIGDKVLGVLDVQQSSVGGLSQGDVVLLQSIANQLAIAVQNTQAYATTQQLAEHEALVSAISQKIQKATSFDEILKTALEELNQALDLQQGSIEIGLSTMHSDREQS